MADYVEPRDKYVETVGILRHLESLFVLSHGFGAAPGEEKIYDPAQLPNEESSCLRKSIDSTMSSSIDFKDADHTEAGRIISLPQKDETPLDYKSNFSIPKALGEEMDALGGIAAWGGSEHNDLQPNSGEDIQTPESFQIEYEGFTEADLGTGLSELSRLRRVQSLAKEYHKGIHGWCQLRGLRIPSPYEFLENVSPPRRFVFDKIEYQQDINTCSTGERLAILLIGSLMDTLFVKLAMIMLSTKWGRWLLWFFISIWPLP
jgi:hypothetical protein